MLDYETFKKQIFLHFYFYEFDDFSLADAYNHLDKTEDGYMTNILGIKIWFNEVNEIYKIDNTFFKIKFYDELYAYQDKVLDQSIKEKGYI